MRRNQGGARVGFTSALSQVSPSWNRMAAASLYSKTVLSNKKYNVSAHGTLDFSFLNKYFIYLFMRTQANPLVLRILSKCLR